MKLTNKQIFWLLLAICVLTLIPFLGLAEYNTKGEPREAVVSFAMLESDNWILPRNSGGDMPFKPPFFYWTVAAVSYILGGVTEFTSRIPSALSLIVTVLATFVFYARRRNANEGLVAGFVCMLCMELHRHAGICRIDMLLTALSIGSSYMLYRWYEQGMKGIPLIATLLMSLGTLAKGPVGFIIPCMIIGVFLLLKKKNFWTICWKLFTCAVLSMILPAIWFYAAYQQGGQEFFDLLYEENVGRMMHTMSYESCVEPWWFTSVTLLYGFVPFTLVAFFALFSIDWKGVGCLNDCPKANCLTRLRNRFMNLDDVTMYSVVGAVLILVFYSIPQSKRSSYIMPMYSFVAYFIARLMIWLAENKKKSLTVYTDFLAVCGLLSFVAFIVFSMNIIPESMFQGRHAADNYATINALGAADSWWEILLILLPTFVCGYWWVFRRSNGIGVKYVYFSIAIVLSIYVAVDGVYKNAVLNYKSVKPVAEELRQIRDSQPSEFAHFYEYIEVAEIQSGDKLRMYELNFYLDNTIDVFTRSKPDVGMLLIGEDDFGLRRNDFEKMGYVFEDPIYKYTKRKVRNPLLVMKFYRFLQ